MFLYHATDGNGQHWPILVNVTFTFINFISKAFSNLFIQKRGTPDIGSTWLKQCIHFSLNSHFFDTNWFSHSPKIMPLLWTKRIFASSLQEQRHQRSHEYVPGTLCSKDPVRVGTSLFIWWTAAVDTGIGSTPSPNQREDSSHSISSIDQLKTEGFVGGESKQLYQN